MSKIKSFDLAKMLIDEVTEERNECVVSPALLKRFRHSCELLDDISDEHDGVAYECEVDEDILDITISLHCPIFEALDATEPFYKLMRRSKRFAMNTSADDEENVQQSFTMEGVWVSK